MPRPCRHRAHAWDADAARDGRSGTVWDPHGDYEDGGRDVYKLDVVGGKLGGQDFGCVPTDIRVRPTKIQNGPMTNKLSEKTPLGAQNIPVKSRWMICTGSLPV
mmetsp:Transcript_4118/g.9244  ORF Transcript_4118/g.9244 Transcript_4118/m.9244 type:complete len:104 (+) Transcript_4118:1210-1521(+)